MTVTTNAQNLQYKIRISLIAEQILAFASYPNIFRELKNLSSNCVCVSLRDRPFYQNMLIYDSDNKCPKLTI